MTATLPFPRITAQQLKDIAYGAVTLLVVTLCFFIALEALTIKTVNAALLNGMAALLSLL